MDLQNALDGVIVDDETDITGPLGHDIVFENESLAGEHLASVSAATADDLTTTGISMNSFDGVTIFQAKADADCAATITRVGNVASIGTIHFEAPHPRRSMIMAIALIDHLDMVTA